LVLSGIPSAKITNWEDHMSRKAAEAVIAAAWIVGATSVAALAGSGFEGTRNVKDTSGKPFEIVLSSGGAAKANLGERMTGVWKEEGNTAVITWATGWTTKITEEDGRYTKTAYRKGQALDGPPANSSEAEKAK
jgi:hypothetical protein